MQLFAELPDGRVVGVETAPGAAETVDDVAERLGVRDPVRVVRGGSTLPGKSTLRECNVGAGDTLRLQGRLRGGSDKKNDKEGGAQEEEEDNEISFYSLLNLWNNMTGKTQGSSGPLLPMIMYIVFLQSGFLLAQISTTFMVISQWGVDDIPKMILGVALAELIKIIPVHHFEHAIYSRQIVLYVLLFTQVLFICINLLYDASLEMGSWNIIIFEQDWAKTSSMLSFIFVEVLVAYNIDSYWLLLEEGCNIQQAKQVFRVVNYGQVGALFIIGFFIGYTPWAFYMSAAALMTLSCVFLLPCQVLIMVVSPAGEKTAANSRTHNKQSSPQLDSQRRF